MKEEAQAAASAQEIHEALYDGVDIQVRDKAGKASMVKVRKIPRDEMARLSLIVGDESEEGELAEAGLYCDRDAEWARSLDEGSLDRVLAEGHRLNFPSYARWFRRRARLLELARDQNGLVSVAQEVLTRLERRGSMSGSSRRGTGTETSGATRPTS